MRGKSLLVSTHNLDEAEYCDRIIIIHNGEIVAAGPPDELLRQKQKANIEELFMDAIREHGQN
jgi:ABC-2 type transport system ATP-binding protein